jgi:hypothetical protein
MSKRAVASCREHSIAVIPDAIRLRRHGRVCKIHRPQRPSKLTDTRDRNFSNRGSEEEKPRR